MFCYYTPWLKTHCTNWLYVEVVRRALLLEVEIHVSKIQIFMFNHDTSVTIVKNLKN